MLVVPNFARTTLRASISPTQTQLALAIGSGSYFEIGAGNYMYVTVEDGQSVEIMRYNCTGPVVNDLITVVRGEDGTSPKAFPAGACVKVAWNVAQMQELINQTFISIFNSTVLPPNTIQVQAVPTAPPTANVYYAVWVEAKRFFYWSGTAWVELGNARDSVLAGYGTPSGTPGSTVSFYVDLNSGAMWYWTGTAWLQVSGQAVLSSEEYWSRSSVAGLALPFLPMTGGLTNPLGGVTATDVYRMYPNGNNLASVLDPQPHAGYTYEHVTLTKPAALSITINIGGYIRPPGSNPPGQVNDATLLLTITSSTGKVFGAMAHIPAGWTSIIKMVATTDVQPFPTGTFFDGNLNYISSAGAAAAPFILTDLTYAYHVIEAGPQINASVARAPMSPPNLF